jgi:trans-2,3-dihydro-3-hydroxyanthranilate isomerase
LEYDVVDVFTARPFAGNPLAVVYGAEALSSDQLHALAMEFNLSETTFPVPLTDDDRAAGADYRLRIFTPGGEIPFAGHPTLGTAWALCRRGLVAPGSRRQACGAGLIGVLVPADEDAGVELSAVPRDHARDLTASETEEVAALVGLTAADAIGPARFAGCGLSWVYLQVADADAVEQARAVGRRLTETSVDIAALRDPVDGVSVYTVTGQSAGGTDAPGRLPLEVSCRVFVPGFGIPEDPATGSAAAGLGVVLVATGQASSDGETSYRIEQGVAMGRPSVLEGRVEAVGGVAKVVHVAGRVAAAASGSIVVPTFRP